MLWLSRFIDNVHVVEFAGGEPITRLPDGRTNLVFRTHEGERSGDLSLAGPRTSALHKTASGIVRWIKIELKRGWSTQLLGVSASALKDQIVPLDDVWGASARALCDQLVCARTVPEALQRISDAFAQRAAQIAEPPSARLARRAVRMLEEEDDVPLGRVAERLGVTPRHLRRAFTDNIGVGPKDFARAVRLQRVLRRAADAADWQQIAVDVGYYDQAHLIADFRALVGVTPAAFARTTAGRQREATPSESAP